MQSIVIKLGSIKRTTDKRLVQKPKLGDYILGWWTPVNKNIQITRLQGIGMVTGDSI